MKKSLFLKLSSLFMSVLMLLCCLAQHQVFMAFDQVDNSGKCGDNLYWEFDYEERLLYIYGEGKMYNYGHPTSSTNPAPWVNFRTYCINIVVDEGCTEIGTYAFSFTSVMNLTLPRSSLKRIGDNAFFLCQRLLTLDIPDGVVEIGAYVFQKCGNLVSAKIGNGVTAIPANTFSGCTALKTVELSESVTALFTQAFANCTSLRSIDISGVEILYNNVFDGCSALSSVVFGEKLKRVGSCVFNGCKALKEINLVTYPDVINSSFASGSGFYESLGVGMYTLFDGKILCNKGAYTGERIVVPDGVVMIAGNCFGNSLYCTEIVIPSSVKIIDDMAFFNFKSLNEVYIPETVEKIGIRNFGFLQEGSRDLFNYNIKIHGKADSAAQRYAFDNNLTFVCDHDLEEVTVVADCTSGGYTYLMCDCGYSQSRKEISSKGHSIVTERVEATCLAGGFEKVYCTDCETVLSYETIEIKGHSLTGYTVVSEPTCTEYGRMVRTCKVCQTEVDCKQIEKKNHSGDKNVTQVLPSCKAEGIRITSCADCGAVLAEEILEKTAHVTAEEWEDVTLSQDIAVPALRVKICKECKAVQETEWYTAIEDTVVNINTDYATALVSDALSLVVSGKDVDFSTESLDYNNDGRINSQDIRFFKKYLR